MKNTGSKLLIVIATALLTACSTEDKISLERPSGRGKVKFVTRTVSSVKSLRGTKAVQQKDEYRILAFKKAENGDCVYVQDIPLDAMSYDGTVLKGEAELPEGDYKFIPVYGLVKPGGYLWPPLDKAVLDEHLCISHTGGSLPEIFMTCTDPDKTPSYTVSEEGPSQTVTSLLRRAVSRVDVLFIRADANGDGTYTEKAGDDVFAPEGLARAELKLTGANNSLGLTGMRATPLSGPAVFDTSHAITDPKAAMTMGSGTRTRLGDPDYLTYDGVVPEDIIAGSAHLRGTYLIPNPDATPTVNLALELTSGAGSVRTVTLPGPIPVERNKITLVRVYVLGDDVFSNPVRLEVKVETRWDGTNGTDVDIQ